MKKGLITALVVSPLAAGIVASVVITSTMVSLNNKSNNEIKSETVQSNALPNYQMLEMSGEEVNYFNGKMPLSLEQVKFINENNNGVSLEQLKDNYIKNEKVLVTDAVKKQIVDNYYTNGFFNNQTLEFRAYNQVVSYPQEAKDLIVVGDEKSYQKANEKIIELWKAKKFQFPWELKDSNLKTDKKAVEQPEPEQPLVLPQPMANSKPLTQGQLKYYNNLFPLSPDQEKFINENNGEWTVAMIRKADSEGKDAYATKAVSDEIIGKYFKKAEISVFKDNLKQVVWNNKAVNYPNSVLSEPTIRKRAEAIIALWKDGNFKFPWEDGAALVPVKGAPPASKPATPPASKPATPLASKPATPPAPEPATPTPPEPAPATEPVPVPEPVAPTTEPVAEMKMTEARGKYLNGTYVLSPELIKYIDDNNKQKYAEMNELNFKEIKVSETVFEHVEQTYKAMFTSNLNRNMSKISLLYNGTATDLKPEEVDAVKKAKKPKGVTYWQIISDLAKAGTIKLPWYTKAA